MLKARRLQEIRELIASPPFVAWWHALSAARVGLTTTEAEHAELLTQTMLMDFRAELARKSAVDTLYRSGECDAAAEALRAERLALENQSFQSVSDFGELRFHTSEIGYRLGAAEHRLEELKERLRSLAAHRDRAQGAARREAESRLSGCEHESKLAERTFRQLHAEYERAAAKKARVCEEVERFWARSTELSLTLSEKEMQAKKVSRDADALFAQAEERKQRAQRLRAEAERAAQATAQSRASLRALLDHARTAFGCAVGDEFLYFCEKDPSRRAFAVSLVADSTTFDIEVEPLEVYAVDRVRGVAFIEPAADSVPPALDDGDRRFEDYFLQGRQGLVKPRTVT